MTAGEPLDTGCRYVEQHIETALDGELGPDARASFDLHVGKCARCAERLQFAEAFRGRLRASFTEQRAPDALRERAAEWVKDSADRGFADSARGAGAGRSHAAFAMPGRKEWRRTWSVGAVALVLLGVGATAQWQRIQRDEGELALADMAPWLKGLLVAPLASAVAAVDRPADLSGYLGQIVDFPVKAVGFAHPDSRFLGASALSLNGEQAVVLDHDVEGRRVTVVAFQLPEAAQRRLRAEAEGGPGVHVVRIGGQTIPLFEHEGVTYAVLSDSGAASVVDMAFRARIRSGGNWGTPVRPVRKPAPPLPAVPVVAPASTLAR